MIIVFRILIFCLIIFLVYGIVKLILSTDSVSKKKKNSTYATDELLKLQNLMEEGIITKKEFEKMKKKLLRKI